MPFWSIIRHLIMRQVVQGEPAHAYLAAHQWCARQRGQSGALPCAANASMHAHIHPSNHTSIHLSIHFHPSVQIFIYSVSPPDVPAHHYHSSPTHMHSGRAIRRLQSFGCALWRVRALSNLDRRIMIGVARTSVSVPQALILFYCIILYHVILHYITSYYYDHYSRT
jgi:hypothetical protein